MAATLLAILAPSGAGMVAEAHAPVGAQSDIPRAALAPAMSIQPLTTPGYDTAIFNQVCSDGSSSTCAPNFPPPEASQSAMAWDPLENVSVLYGGSIGVSTELNETWVYGAPSSDGGNFNATGWVDLRNNFNQPSARSNMTLVYDAADGYDVLFGGYTGTGARYASDTWEFISSAIFQGDLPPWEQLSPSTSPSARAGYSMVYVPVHSGHGGYVLLFGGKGSGNQFQSDTWEFSGGQWTNVTSTAGTPPSARAEAGIAYDSVDNYVVLFGGLTTAGPVNSTYEFNPATGTWSQLYANASTSRYAGPKGLFSPQMTMDSEDGAVILNGGSVGSLATANAQTVIGYKQTWYFLGGDWTNITSFVGRNDNAAGTQTPLPQFGAPFVDALGFKYTMWQGGKSLAGLYNATYQFGTLLSTTVATNLGEVVTGNPVTVWTNSSFGALPYTYSWSVPSGCESPGNVSTFSCSPSATGWQAFSVTVTDVVGATVTEAADVWVDTSGTGSESFSVSHVNPVTIPSSFWAFDWRCTPENLAACVQFVDQTPVHWFRVAGSMEGYNATSGVEYSRFGGTTTVNWNWNDIVNLCQQVRPCYTVPTLPTSNNDSGLAVADAEYVLRNYSYQPTYWSLGNEPQGWVAFNEPFSPTPLPTPYTRLTGANAYQVGIAENKVGTAVLAADPAGNLILIQSAQCGNVSFNYETAIYAGHDGQAPVLACHVFSAGFGPTAGQTAAGILSPAVITKATTNIVAEREGISYYCPSCNLPIWATEVAISNNGGSNQAYLGGWVDAAFYGTQLVQFAENDVGQMEAFNVACGLQTQFALLTQSCGPTPVSELYTNIFDHLNFQQAYAVTPTGAVGSVYAIEGVNGSARSLYVVNANTTVTLTSSSLGLALGGLTTVYSGSPSTGWEVSQYPSASSVPSSWAIPPLGELLINTGNASILYAPSIPPQNNSLHTTAASCLFVCQLWNALLSERAPPIALSATFLMAVGGSLAITTRHERLFGVMFVLGVALLIL